MRLLAEMVFLTSSLLARVQKHTNEFFGRPQISPDRYSQQLLSSLCI
jgi:hypothetical protein